MGLRQRGLRQARPQAHQAVLLGAALFGTSAAAVPGAWAGLAPLHQSGLPPRPQEIAQAGSPFVGRWGCITFRVGGGGYGSGVCPAGWSDLRIEAGGTYRMGATTGSVRLASGLARFSGGLSFMGPARLTSPDQFEFLWQDQGVSYWAVFIRT